MANSIGWSQSVRARDGRFDCCYRRMERLRSKLFRSAFLAANLCASRWRRHRWILSDRFLFHKTTNRTVYDQAVAQRPDCDDVILWNERGEITESSVANVVVSIDGQLFTPPQTSGLLAGTFRDQLLADGEIRERVILIEELQQASKIVPDQFRAQMDASGVS